MKNFIVTFLSLFFFCFVANAQRSDESVSAEHAVIQADLHKIDQLIGTLIYGDAKDAKQIKKQIVTMLGKNLVPHSEKEEAGLYTDADQMAGDQRYSFTTRIRYEHVIIKRRLKALTDSVNLSGQDIVFARKADQLLGLITAHFEQEEKLVIPLVKFGTTPKANGKD